jgi:hypothetical protein
MVAVIVCVVAGWWQHTQQGKQEQMLLNGISAIHLGTVDPGLSY